MMVINLVTCFEPGFFIFALVVLAKFCLVVKFLDSFVSRSFY